MLLLYALNLPYRHFMGDNFSCNQRAQFDAGAQFSGFVLQIELEQELFYSWFNCSITNIECISTALMMQSWNEVF
jgi:hypothetical protein